MAELRIFARVHADRGGNLHLDADGAHHVPQEALIGIVYVVAAALGMLLLSRSAEGTRSCAAL